jgi:hypothetical protein
MVHSFEDAAEGQRSRHAAYLPKLLPDQLRRNCIARSKADTTALQHGDTGEMAASSCVNLASDAASSDAR